MAQVNNPQRKEDEDLKNIILGLQGASLALDIYTKSKMQEADNANVDPDPAKTQEPMPEPNPEPEPEKDKEPLSYNRNSFDMHKDAMRRRLSTIMRS